MEVEGLAREEVEGLAREELEGLARGGGNGYSARSRRSERR